MDTHNSGFYSSSGVVLKRTISPEGDLVVHLFLKKFGRVQTMAKGAGRGSVRFGGATEPFVWGNFGLYKSAKGGRFVIRSIDVKHDGTKLRTSESFSLPTAFKWTKLIIRYLEENVADDKVLSCLYWSQLLLEEGVPHDLVDFRFVWRWLNLWGLAPQLEDETLRFVALAEHDEIKNIREADAQHLATMRALCDRYVPIFDNMI